MGLSKDLSVVVLAAGKGKRMKSELPKVLHRILGQPVLYYVLSSSVKLNPKNIFTVVGYKKEAVSGYIRKNFPGVKIIVQEKQLGTAHAVYTTTSKRRLFGKNTLVLSADTPLVSPELLKKLVEKKEKLKSDAAIVTSVVPDPRGYGRIIKDRQGNIIRIVEETDATREEKKINEVNSSIYCFETKTLFENIGKVRTQNIQKEYYLTDIIEMLVKSGKKVTCLEISDYMEVMGINDRAQLSIIESIVQEKINKNLMKSGVTIKNPQSCYIENSVIVERDVTIKPWCLIKGKTIIRKNSVIGPFCQIMDAIIGKGSVVNSSVIIDSDIGDNSNIGPYTYMKSNVIIKNENI